MSMKLQNVLPKQFRDDEEEFRVRKKTEEVGRRRKRRKEKV